MKIYISSGFLKLVGVLEMAGGAALLLNRFVSLSVTVIAAIMFNATVFHVLHDPAGVVPAALCLSLSLALVFAHKTQYAALLKA